MSISCSLECVVAVVSRFFFGWGTGIMSISCSPCVFMCIPARPPVPPHVLHAWPRAGLQKAGALFQHQQEVLHGSKRVFISIDSPFKVHTFAAKAWQRAGHYVGLTASAGWQPAEHYQLAPKYLRLGCAALQARSCGSIQGITSAK